MVGQVIVGKGIGDLQGDTQTHGENKECGHLTVSKQGKGAQSQAVDK
jgi:hypothetical protein